MFYSTLNLNEKKKKDDWYKQSLISTERLNLERSFYAFPLDYSLHVEISTLYNLRLVYWTHTIR